MFTFKTAQMSLIALLLGATTITSISPAYAKPYSVYSNAANDYEYSSGVIDAGTRIPVNYEEETIQIDQGDSIPLTLTVARPIRDRNGSVLIPAGSTIEGRLESVGRGVRYIAREIRIDNREWLTFNAASDVVGRTETVNIGTNTANIVKGTLSGAGAATIIAGTTGDRRIDALEVLAGAAVGTLAGWGLPEAGIVGGGKKEVVIVNPNRDLTLVVQSPLYLEHSYEPTYDRYPNRRPVSPVRWSNDRK